MPWDLDRLTLTQLLILVQGVDDHNAEMAKLNQ